MSARVVVCANMKGGVGKTTVAVSLAEGTRHLTLGKVRTLIIDLDLQMNASTTLVRDSGGAEPWYHGKTIETFLRARHQRQALNPMSLIHSIDDGLHLLSGKLTLLNFERSMLSQRNAVGIVRNDLAAWLSDLLHDLRDYFDLILIDTPPGLSLLAEAAIQQADLIIVPTVPNRLSQEGISTYAKYLTRDLQLTTISSKVCVLINMQPPNLTRTAMQWIERIGLMATEADFPYRLFSARYTLIDAFRKAMDVDRPEVFDRVWGGAAPAVLAATRQLWSFLDAPLHERG